MAKEMEYPDFSKPLDQNNQEYPDFSQPNFAEQEKKPFSLRDLVSGLAKTPPPGMNLLSGLMSIGFPEKQGELVKNLPQIAQGRQPTTGESIQHFAGEMLPVGEIGGPAAISGAKAVGAGTVNTAKEIGSLFKNVNPKELMGNIQQGHDKLLNLSSGLYDFVKNEANFVGKGAIDVSHDLIEQAKDFLPNTDAVKKLIERAKAGDYNAIHSIQSDLGKKGTGSLSHELGSEQNKGAEMLELRDKINDEVAKKFHEYGRPDLAKILENASHIYKNLKETYYSHPAISKLVHSETRKMPKNPLGLLSEESVQMNRILKAHPEIKEALTTVERRKSLGKRIGKGLLLKGIPAAGGLYGAKTLLDKFLGDY